MKPSVYILKNDDHTSSSIIVALLNQFNDEELIAVIGKYEETENTKVQKFDNLSHYLMHIYRKLRLHKNERQTIYSEEDQLLATQLCMADYNREKYDLYDAATSEVLATSDHLIRDAIDGAVTAPDSVSNSKTSKDEYNDVAKCYQEFLKTCNSLDLATAFCDVKSEFLQSEVTATNHWSKSKCVVLQWPRNMIEASFLSLLCRTSGRYFQTTAEVPVSVDTSQLTADKFVISTEEVVLPSCEEMLVKSIPSSCATPRMRKPATDQSLSATEIYFKRVFLSYLTLVVNTRDEIALARCFNVPDRELDHEAFTALKREARQKNMPMCQTATSYVMKIRIVRNGCNANSQIAQYVRGLSEFVSLIQKLQVIVEEERNPSSALVRLINQIKTAFLKAKNIGFNKEIIERVVRYLKLSVGKLSAGDSLETPLKSVGNGGSMAGAKTIKLLKRLLDQEASQVASRRPVNILCDGMASQGTPIRLPSLMSMFRSPAIPSPDSPENQSLADRLIQRESEQVGMKRMGYRSCMMWADPNELQTDQCVNPDYLMAIANDNTQHSPRNGWKNTIWASEDDNNAHNNRNTETLQNINDDTSLEVIDTISNREPCNKVRKGVTDGETPKGRGTTKRQPFREMNEQSVMKKAKNDKPNPKKAMNDKQNPKKKKKVIQQVKGQKTLSNFFRV